ncbi:MAG TPA: hypothetical protein VJM31_12790 [Vicinamibacterales bacterium]|nr:hypothetical protein [Vicinamibacterales bacterium]
MNAVKVAACAVIVFGLFGAVRPGAGQGPARPAPATAAQIQARQQISSFEAALENAVRSGAQMLDQRLQASSAANMVMLAGLARARGFRLDDYGVLFDVEFPSMRRSMVWSMQELERASTGRARQASDTSSSVQPREIYQSEITEALITAILDFPGAIGVGAAEWLTIAARESVVDRRFVPGDPGDTAITVILRMKGGDLNALRGGTLARDEARKRVEIKQY